MNGKIEFSLGKQTIKKKKRMAILELKNTLSEIKTSPNGWAQEQNKMTKNQ